MNSPFIFNNLRSNYCKVVFAVSLIVGFFLVPQDIFHSVYKFIAFPFVLIFAFTMACMVRTIKERAKSALHKGSVISVISAIIGVSALHVCGISAPVCGSSIGMGIISIIFPGFMFNFLREYSVPIVILTMFAQVISLYFMKCFSVSHKPS